MKYLDWMNTFLREAGKSADLNTKVTWGLIPEHQLTLFFREITKLISVPAHGIVFEDVAARIYGGSATPDDIKWFSQFISSAPAFGVSKSFNMSWEQLAEALLDVDIIEYLLADIPLGTDLAGWRVDMVNVPPLEDLRDILGNAAHELWSPGWEVEHYLQCNGEGSTETPVNFGAYARFVWSADFAGAYDTNFSVLFNATGSGPVSVVSRGAVEPFNIVWLDGPISIPVSFTIPNTAPQIVTKNDFVHGMGILSLDKLLKCVVLRKA